MIELVRPYMKVKISRVAGVAKSVTSSLAEVNSFKAFTNCLTMMMLLDSHMTSSVPRVEGEAS